MTDYYATTAYNSKHIPAMSAQTHKAGSPPFYVRMPWGSNKNTMYDKNLFNRFPPSRLQEYKKTDRSYDYIGDKRFGAISHEFIRPDSIERSSRFWMFLYGAGVFLTPVSIFIAIVTMLISPLLGLGDFMYEIPIILLKLCTLPLIGCYIVGYIVTHYIPILSRRPGLGSKWELNRQTGMVTNYTYDKKEPGNPIAVDSVPFYECDAYLWSFPDRYGMTHSIVLGHRYSDRVFWISDILGRVSIPMVAYTYWDFIQNYMDISKPLPDIPILEKFRSLDPVTIEYDKQTNRDPYYYLNMDKKTWKQIKKSLKYTETVQDRHCLMEQQGVVYLPICCWG